MKRINQLRIEIGPPQVTQDRITLFRRWHHFREEARNWPQSGMDEGTYRSEFAFPHPSAREIAYYDDLAPGGSRLVGVGLCDETPQGWSAVYFYYDPDYAHWSLGILNVIFQIHLAKSLHFTYLYLGYYVKNSPSMLYKATFQPHEILNGYPEQDVPPQWDE